MAHSIQISENGTEFNSTWKWSDNPLSVHSFPNIKLNSNILPLQLSNLSSLNISASWTMAPSNSKQGTDLASIETAANVIIDMFLDPNSTIANSTTLPQYEVMVWIAAFDGKLPIGYSSSMKNPPKQILGGIELYASLNYFCVSLLSKSSTLYMGQNSNGQYVYSWLAPGNIYDFNEDISLLLHYLWRHKYIDESNFLGTVQFGTETFHSTSNVTFSTQNFNLSVHSGKPQVASSGNLNFVPHLKWVVIAIICSWNYVSTI